MIKRTILLLMIIITCFIVTLPALATSPDKAYVYNHSQEAVPIPNPYKVERIIGGSLSDFTHPEDMICRGDELYILDSGNREIDVLDTKYNRIQTITIKKNGQPYPLSDPKGIWMDNKDRFYIADRGLKEILVTDRNGEVLTIIKKPKTELLTETDDFLPVKVLTDHTGLVYILSENEYRGAITVNLNGEFMGFFGSNTVTVTSEVIRNTFWRIFMTKEQISRSRKYLPMEYSGLAIDSRDFVYACRGTTSDMKELIRKLNPEGINVLQNKEHYGDYNLGVQRGEWYFTDFTAVTVDEQGFIFALDATWNRIFQYSSEGELLYVFGASGDQVGSFSMAVDIECRDDRVLVLDKEYGTVTVFKPTLFGQSVREAEQLYQEGRFTESIAPWREVLRQNSNYEFAYVGIGKALYVTGQYKEAMDYFKLGFSHNNYSLAFKRYRTRVLRANFTPVIAVILLLLLIPVIIKILRKRKILPALSLERSGRFKYTAYILFHPSDGFEELRYNNKGSLAIANAVLVLWLFGTAFQYQYQGFIFNYRDPEDFNVFITFLSTIGIFSGWAVANWLLSTFLEGKGNLKNTWLYSAYALIPYVASLYITTILSNVMSADEGVFLRYLQIAGLLWSGFLLFVAIKSLHQYSFKVNVASIALTIFGILIIIFLIFLMFSLFTQLSSFITTIFSEALYRIQSGK